MAQADWQAKEGTQVLLVAGMHRSGTSMVMRIANLLGVELGNHLVAALPHNNETGFWEHEHIVTLHEELLEHYDSHHLSMVDLPTPYLTLNPVQRTQQQLFGVLRRDFSYHHCWGVKDPRLSLLADLWHDTLGELNVKPTWLISVRHPLEVAQSLQKRNGISIEQGLLLWLKYNFMLERSTRGHERVFVGYYDVLEDWEASMKRVSVLTGFTWPITYRVAGKSIKNFIRSDLKHQQATEKAHLPYLVAQLWEVLYATTQSEDGTLLNDVLDELWWEYQTGQFVMQEEYKKLQKKSRKQTEDIQELQQHLAVILGSDSWRITKPLRCAMAGLRHLRR